MYQLCAWHLLNVPMACINCAHGMYFKLTLTMTQLFRKRHYQLINLWEMGSFHIVLGIRVCENCELGQIWIHLYRFWEWAEIFIFTFIFFCSLKRKNIIRTWPIVKPILHHCHPINFFRLVKYKKVTKRWDKGAPHWFFKEVSILVLTDIIAILLTPGLFSFI